MRSRPYGRRERGAAAVEMALILPVLLLVLGGIVDLGRAMYGQIIVSNAAREGARMASMTSYTNAQVQTRAQSATGGLVPLAGSAVDVTIPSPRCVADPLDPSVKITTVAVTARNFQWMMLNVVPRLVGGNIPAPAITAKASMRCVG